MSEELVLESSEGQSGINLKDVLAALKRRRKPFFLGFLGLFLVFVGLALFLPPKYRSSAKILIEKQGISPELIQTSVASYAEQQIQEVTQKVMTRTNLLEIIDKFDLYPNQRKRKTKEELIKLMREDIGIDFINAEMSDPRMGNRPLVVMVAFELSYRYRDPKVAQQVLSQLVSLFLEENARARTQTASDAVRFLEEEGRRLKQEMTELQEKLAKFKEDNLERLPEVANIYRDEISRIENQLLQLDAQERSLQDRIFYLKGQLLQIDPYAMGYSSEGKPVLSVQDRLKALRSQYPSLLARYSPDHPEVIRAKKEIAALEKEVKQGEDPSDLRVALKAKQSELASLRERYSAKHPDVLKLEREVAALKQQLQAAVRNKQDEPEIKADNPAYITLQAQLKAAEEELASLAKTRASLRQRQAELRTNLAASPLVEKEYRTLLEDLDATLQRYRDIRARELQAKVSEQFEIEKKGERLTLIDPPQIPEEASFPNRPLLLFLGVCLGLVSGVVSALTVELLDDTVQDARAVLLYAKGYPLATIPYLSLEEASPWFSGRRLAGAVVIVGGLTVLVVVHFFISPLDVLWFRILNKLLLR